MPLSESPCLNLAIARLSTGGSENFAIWVLRAPYSGGYVLHDCRWPQTLTQAWIAWQEMFAPHKPLQAFSKPVFEKLALAPDVIKSRQSAREINLPTSASPPGQTTSYSSRLMQHLGISLFGWLFEGPIRSSLEHSQGIASGKDKPLRLRLEIRDPDLIALPWEIMQPQLGLPAISLSQQLLFSRTTSDVDPLPSLPTNHGLNILLVLGQNAPLFETSSTSSFQYLQLEQEAATLAQTLKSCGQLDLMGSTNLATAKCQVDTLIQPTPTELISQLETHSYNIFFYAGHGLPAPDGGLLFLRPGMTLNGTELAQVLTRARVTLCVVNACWGAQPAAEQQALPRSSLAEVLIHHGVPAVLGMRDEIADPEALSFIQAFAQALAARLPIDRAMAIARQQLLTLYKFNYPAWTLPVLYLHPEFDGELVRLPHEDITQLPENSLSGIGQPLLIASLRSLSTPGKVWSLRAGVARLGRLAENDIVISEPWVSQRHAEIFYRNSLSDSIPVPTYFLRDNSRFGTLLLGSDGWQKVHRQEVPLKSGMQLKFGSSQGQTFEFIIEI